MESSCSGTGSVSGSPTSYTQNNCNKNLKHFKKAFIVEYERIESHHSGCQEDSNSSESSMQSTTTSSSSSNSATSNTTNSTSNSSISHPISFANSISIQSNKTLDDNYFKRKFDLYEDENTSSESESDERIEIKRKKPEFKSQKFEKKSSPDNKAKTSQKQKIETSNHNKVTTSSKQSTSSKEDKSSKKKIYCICKSADTKRFMIACDNCDDWFHGDCVGVTQSLSKKIKAFFCHLCRNEKPKLKIKYKSKYFELSKNLNKEKAAQLTDTHSDESYIKFYKETQIRLKKESELLKKHNNKHQKPKNNEESLENKKVKIESEDKTKTEKVYTKTQVSNEDIENFMSAITKLNDSSNFTQLTEPTKTDHDYIKQQQNDDENSSNCMQTDTGDEVQDETNSETETQSETDSDYDDETDDSLQKQQQTKKTLKKQLTKKDVKTKQKNLKPCNKIMKQNLGLTLGMGTSTRPRRPTDEIIKESKHLKQSEQEPGQCLGPECTNQALSNSKYCSHDCGMRLAKNRLVYFLKDRYEQYNETECLSDKLNMTELDKIEKQILQMKKKLLELEQKHVDLDKIIYRAKNARINPNVEKEREKSMDSNETEIYCVSCGQQCSEKHALKHMEKCFNKIESQAFFASFYKSHIDGQSMFCDYYSPQTKMYCKRLKVMCPEHEKEKKVGDDEVCGYPLPKLGNILEDSEDQICLAPKRSCSLHFKWEKLRRAVIDLEKLRTWLKLEELAEQKRQNEMALNQRKDLLSILLHQTTVRNDESVNNNSKNSECLNTETSVVVRA